MEYMLLENRVKLHIFEPSGRTIWTVVGKSKEHWIDPDAHFCACNGYHYNDTCYHLDLTFLAIKHDVVETIHFSDDEFSNFMSGIICDL